MATINNIINSQHWHQLKPPQNCQEFCNSVAWSSLFYKESGVWNPHLLFVLTIYLAKKKKKKSNNFESLQQCNRWQMVIDHNDGLMSTFGRKGTIGHWTTYDGGRKEGFSEFIIWVVGGFE